MKKTVLSLLLLVLTIGIVTVNFINTNKPDASDISASQTNKNTSTSIGSFAPNFELTTLSGETMQLYDYRGKKVILNFWASWCPPCKAEMPHMQNFYEDYKDSGIEIIAVNLTNNDHGEAAIANFVSDYKLSFPIPLDVDGTVGNTYQIITIPTSYIIDSNGIITEKVVGPMDVDIMENLTKVID